MRLLDKQTISQEKSVERKMEIDEGVKLAQKVNTLRETLAKEQANLIKFRDESLAEIRRSISKLNEEKEAISQRVEALKLERAELRKPLDKEWARVHEESDRLEEITGELNQRRFALLQIEKDLDGKTKELKLEEERIEEQKRRTASSIKNSEHVMEKAQETLAEAERIRVVSQETSDSQKEELLKQWAEVETEKRNNKSRQAFLDKKEKALEDKDRMIRDKYETLIRTQKRLKNG